MYILFSLNVPLFAPSSCLPTVAFSFSLLNILLLVARNSGRFVCILIRPLNVSMTSRIYFFPFLGSFPPSFCSAITSRKSDPMTYYRRPPPPTPAVPDVDNHSSIPRGRVLSDPPHLTTLLALARNLRRVKRLKQRRASVERAFTSLIRKKLINRFFGITGARGGDGAPLCRGDFFFFAEGPFSRCLKTILA